MQFKQGTHVYTSDGQDVGTVDRVVLDPQTNEVSEPRRSQRLAVH